MTNKYRVGFGNATGNRFGSFCMQSIRDTQQLARTGNCVIRTAGRVGFGFYEIRPV